MIKAIIFDCFGVLISDALSGIIDEMYVTDTQKGERIRAIVHAASRGMISSEASRELVAEQLGVEPEIYSQRLREGEIKNQELLAYIKQLRTKYKTGILSNVSPNGLDVRFTSEELAEHFDAVVASGVVGFAKPEARAYEIIADWLGVRLDECVMIDDRERFCEGARSVGMQAIYFKSNAQLFAVIKKMLPQPIAKPKVKTAA